MLFAMSPNDDRIKASPKAEGYCSYLKCRLIPKCGKINIWHWSYPKGINNPHYEPETEWHLGMKEWLADLFNYPDGVEKFFNRERRTDFNIGNICIELQKSSIDIREVVARNNFYNKIGIKVLWIFYFDNKISTFGCNPSEMERLGYFNISNLRYNFDRSHYIFTVSHPKRFLKNLRPKRNKYLLFFNSRDDYPQKLFFDIKWTNQSAKYMTGNILTKDELVNLITRNK